MIINLHRTGESRCRQWAKRRWNDAPDWLHNIVRPYMEKGWNVTDCQSYARGRFYKIWIEQCHLTRADDGTEKSFTHVSVLQLSKRKGIEKVIKFPTAIGLLTTTEDGKTDHQWIVEPVDTEDFRNAI